LGADLPTRSDPTARSELPRHLDLGKHLDRTPPYDPHEPTDQKVDGAPRVMTPRFGRAPPQLLACWFVYVGEKVT
jgi:hypothetical protein